ncbi:MAG TPA: hypothetical protein DF613_13205 [Lachnospiraceae bacterium]|nr:hypothetical protein [Lachnospiraceae bacterium]
MARALKTPAARIAYNAGKNGDAVVDRLLREQEGIGYDAKKDRYVDMLKEGITEPSKVTCTALSCAVSVASTILTTEAAVVISGGKGDKQ